MIQNFQDINVRCGFIHIWCSNASFRPERKYTRLARLLISTSDRSFKLLFFFFLNEDYDVFQEEPQYEEPPCLPPQSNDFLEVDAPLVPHRSAEMDKDEEEEEEEEEDKGVYEDLSELAPPAPAGQKSTPQKSSISKL